MSIKALNKTYHFFFGNSIKGLSRGHASAVLALRRVILMLCCSALLHFGALAILNVFVPPPKQKTPVAATQAKSKTSTKSKLEQLQGEKKALIKKLTGELRTGQISISLDEFLLKSQILDQQIRVLKENPQASEAELQSATVFQQVFNNVAAQANGWVSSKKTERAKIANLHFFAHYKMFRAYLRDSTALTTVLSDGIFNCSSSTAFVTALQAKLVGAKDFGVVLLDPPKDPKKGKDGHMRSWYQDQHGLWQIENTDGGPPRIIPFTKGLRTPSNIFVAAYLVRNGVKVAALPDRLAKLYSLGVGKGGFPVAGVSTDLPKPPNELVPNPYFGVKDPKKLAKQKKDTGDTKELFKNVFVRTAEIIKFARVDVMMRALYFQKLSSQATLTLFNVPREIDWCKIAAAKTDKPLLGSGHQTYDVRLTGYSDPYRYLTAVSAADILLAQGNNKYQHCTSKSEQAKYYSNIKGIMQDNLQNKVIIRLLNLRRIFSFADMSHALDLTMQAKHTACLFHFLPLPPKYMPMVIAKLGKPSTRTESCVLYGLGNAVESEAEIAIKALYSATQNLNNDLSAIATSLARLGEGRQALDLSKRLVAANPEEYDQNKHLFAEITSLHKNGPASQADIKIIKDMVNKEKDSVAKAQLIAILSINGQTKVALQYTKTMIMPIFASVNLKNADAEEIVLALGRIESPQTKALLMQIFALKPELAPEIASIFVQQGFRDERIIQALKSIVYNGTLEADRRKYAAVFLIEMGGL